MPDASNTEMYDALQDVANWLGFLHYGEYLPVLQREREAIFKRATY